MNTNLTFNLQPSNHIERLIKSISSLSLSKDMNFIEKLVRKGFVVDSDGYWKEEWQDNYINQLNDIVRNLNVAYGDNWDLYFSCTSKRNNLYNHEDYLNARDEGESYPHSKYEFDTRANYIARLVINVVVHYKKLEVTNSNAGLQKVDDLMVLLLLRRNEDFSDFNFKLVTPRGARFNYTYEQFKYGYLHSHLEQRSIDSFSSAGMTTSFCTGTSSEIGDIMIELGANGFDEGLFGLFLTMLDTMVSWESLEGVPHIKMRNIVNTDNLIINHDRHTLQSYYDSFISFFNYSNERMSEFNVNYVFNEGRYQVRNDDKLEETIKYFIENHPYGNLKKDLLTKEKDGHHYGMDLRLTESKEDLVRHLKNSKDELPYTIISGKKVELKVKSFRGKKIDETEYNVYPKFKKYVIQKLESELYKKAITSSVVRRRNQLNNA